MFRGSRGAAGALLSGLLVACGGGSDGGGGAAPAPPALSAAATAGKAIFFDTSLSASGKQACGTCHVPAYAFAGNPATDGGRPTPLGGRHMDLQGFRNAPSLRYAALTPPFSVTDGPTGGFFRDGRASSLATQAVQPFVTEFEMANANAAEVVTRLQASSATLQLFVAAYGEAVLSDPETTLTKMGQALAAYETEATAEFQPFSSKYDAWVAGNAQLTADEAAGLALFNNPAKGNCTACHPSQRQGYSDHPLFTDFTYDNIGVPRNWQIAANLPEPLSPISGVPLDYVPLQQNVPADAEYRYYDMGLCGPFAPAPSDPNPRPLFTQITSMCGLFKVPTLRNIAITSPYFHNGEFATLHKVVQWYVTRDINNNTGNNPTPVPAGPGGNAYFPVGTSYVTASGTPDLYQYNDLPVEFDANVNIGEVPYTPPTLAGGQAPTLTTAEIDQVVAFLCTLTDGYDPQSPAAYNVPAQCQPGAE